MSKTALIDSVFKQHSLSTKTGKTLSRAAVGRLVDSVFEHAGKQIVSTGYFRYPNFGSFAIKYTPPPPRPVRVHAGILLGSGSWGGGLYIHCI
jgi:nucleoid DNA-binding protein